MTGSIPPRSTARFARWFALTERARGRLSAHDHMPALDGLRGLAVLFVLARHFGMNMQMEFGWPEELLKPLRLGWIGVDLFFVLSGFLITSILWDAKQSGADGYFKTFYARRALRIFPLYYLALVVALGIGAVLPSAGVWSGAHPAWQWVYLTNVIQAGGESFGMTPHFWSLAVEEHFYLVWPAVVLLLGRRTLMCVAAAAIAIALLLRATQLDGSGLSPAAYVLTPMRMDSLAAGALLALLLRGRAPLKNYLKPALAVAALAAMAFTAVLFARSNLDYEDVLIGTVGLSFLCALFAATILLALAWRPVEWVFSAPLLRWFGKISYGIYVWHLIVFTVVFHTEWARSLRPFEGLAQSLAVAAVALGGALAVSLASWHLWEKPFLTMKAAFEPRTAPERVTAWDSASAKS